MVSDLPHVEYKSTAQKKPKITQEDYDEAVRANMEIQKLRNDPSYKGEKIDMSKYKQVSLTDIINNKHE